ncbi:MC064R [Molluscum contagiosum virus]|uniref:MC064R n=1 Tax=Molluscum contagiosum virus TaxID=10279 RepID=A0A858A2D1_9POXV|nr:MC064R [Molluscum contagiosum virus]
MSNTSCSVRVWLLACSLCSAERAWFVLVLFACGYSACDQERKTWPRAQCAESILSLFLHTLPAQKRVVTRCVLRSTCHDIDSVRCANRTSSRTFAQRSDLFRRHVRLHKCVWLLFKCDLQTSSPRPAASSYPHYPLCLPQNLPSLLETCTTLFDVRMPPSTRTTLFDVRMPPSTRTTLFDVRAPPATRTTLFDVRAPPATRTTLFDVRAPPATRTTLFDVRAPPATRTTLFDVRAPPATRTTLFDVRAPPATRTTLFDVRAPPATCTTLLDVRMPPATCTTLLDVRMPPATCTTLLDVRMPPATCTTLFQMLASV